MRLQSIYKKVSLLLATTGMAFLLSGCVQEDTPVKSNPQDPDYFSVRIKMSTITGSRADETDFPNYVDGEEYEHQIDFSGNSQHFVIFFNDSYKYAGYSLLELDTEHSHEVGSITEATYYCPVRPGALSAYKYGLIILNSRGLLSRLDQIGGGASIDEFLALLEADNESQSIGRSDEYFTMSSSVYLQQNSVSGVWEHKTLFEIDHSKVFETIKEARENPAAIAYVERMLAKFSARFLNQYGMPSSPVQYKSTDYGSPDVDVCWYENGNPVYRNSPWRVDIVGWGMTGQETEEYVFKDIIGNNAYGSYPYVLASNAKGVDNLFFEGWNREQDKRSFWSYDTHYTTGYYPHQYREAVDNTAVLHYNYPNRHRALKYLSYDELDNNMTKNGDMNGSGLGPHYTPENTFEDEHTNGRWEHDFRATQFLVGAKLRINQFNDFETNRDDYDVFRNRVGIFYGTKTDFLTYFILTFNSQMYSQAGMPYTYYDWENPSNNKNNSGKPTFAADASDYQLYLGDTPLTLDRIREILSSGTEFLMPATIEGGDGKVIPWIDGLYVAYYDQSRGEIVKMDIDDNHLKSVIYEWVGAFDHFNQGAMYYIAPIRHNATSADATSDNYEAKIGDYGVVRNHWYQINVTAIKKIGTPVDRTDEKIIPYTADTQNSLFIDINVLDWHIFETSVLLPD